MAFDLTSYKVLSFDIYGTLIDWETGILSALQPLLNQLPASSPYHLSSASSNPPSPTSPTGRALLTAFATHERTLQATHPSLPYDRLLAQVYTLLATQTLALPSSASPATAAATFGSSVGAYPAFPDTVAAMRLLKQHYALIALSNVDNANFARTLAGPLQGRVSFDAVYTAEDIGSYKPDVRNFEYLIRGVEGRAWTRGDILHVAQGLVHDHVPAREVGLRPGVWIRRGVGMGGTEDEEKKNEGEGEGMVAEGRVMGGDVESLQREGKIVLGAVHETLGELAEAVEKAFKRAEGGVIGS